MFRMVDILRGSREGENEHGEGCGRGPRLVHNSLFISCDRSVTKWNTRLLTGGNIKKNVSVAITALTEIL